MELTPAQHALLQALEDGQFHSGEALGHRLGISRAAIWKHLQSLQALGILLQAQRGQGYCWQNPFPVLNAAAIRAALSPSAQPLLRELQLWPSLDSTNSALLRHAAQRSIEGLVVCAEQQTHGKGRRGRAWVSPVSGNLYLSLGGHFEQGVATLEGLSLAVAVVVVQVLKSFGIQGLQVKWPNDLLLDGKKLGGILLEIGGDLNGQGYLVVGLGLNYALSPQQSESIQQPSASLNTQLPASARNALAGALISRLLQLLASYGQTGFSPYKNTWESLNAYYGQTVSVTQGHQTFIGVCQQLTPNGGLCVDTPQGPIILQGGEISLRPHHDTGM